MPEVVDTTRWPVAVVLVDAMVDLTGAQAITAELDSLFARRQPMGIVFDYQAGLPEAQQHISQWLAERALLSEPPITGAVTVVAEDRVDHIRAMIESGTFSMPFPTWASSTIDEGVDWCAQLLRGQP